MDIRHLKAFIAVFEARNITIAAQRLCVAQPTLSVTIRQLEEELGAELFLRQARGVEVSEQARGEDGAGQQQEQQEKQAA
ncbi:MAG: LysR family transcriptional regulator, partial [Pseudomonas sp.]|nr:LysR family transcriptional regulator [Pseudomonas sp.]